MELADGLGELAQQWRSAERRLYPIVLSDPEAYQRYVLAVRALADDLGAIASPQALAEAYRDGSRRASATLAASGRPFDANAAGLVAGAAFALRHRELAAELEAAEVAGQLAAASRSGQEWVVVREAGRPELAELGQYRRLEVHLPDGVGLHCFAEPQVDTDRPSFVVEVLPLDPATGAARAEVDERHTFGDPDAWAAGIAQLRHRIGRRPDPTS